MCGGGRGGPGACCRGLCLSLPQVALYGVCGLGMLQGESKEAKAMPTPGKDVADAYGTDTEGPDEDVYD